MTASDFGRTLTFNGAGTDHGWGGNHFILGGRVRGGQILNRFLPSYDLAVGNERVTGRGRIVPEYPWENIMVPVAEWMGVTSAADISTVFPNLANFNRAM